MSKNSNKIVSNYNTQRYTSAIISFIGISFIIVAGLNLILDIPVEYVMGVSFAAFFFVWADFILIFNSDEKPLKEKTYLYVLLLAVMSFILMPLILPSFPIVKDLMADSSESVSIASLGLVLIIMHMKMRNAENELFNELNNMVIKNEENFNKLSNIPLESVKRTEDLIKRSSDVAEESLLLSKDTMALNKSLIELIEEGNSLEEIREEVKKYK